MKLVGVGGISVLGRKWFYPVMVILVGCSSEAGTQTESPSEVTGSAHVSGTETATDMITPSATQSETGEITPLATASEVTETENSSTPSGARPTMTLGSPTETNGLSTPSAVLSTFTLATVSPSLSTPTQGQNSPSTSPSAALTSPSPLLPSPSASPHVGTATSQVASDSPSLTATTAPPSYGLTPTAVGTYSATPSSSQWTPTASQGSSETQSTQTWTPQTPGPTASWTATWASSTPTSTATVTPTHDNTISPVLGTPTSTFVPVTPSPIPPALGGDSCETALLIQAGLYVGTTDGLANTYEPACAPQGALGSEAVFSVDLDAREMYRARGISDDVDLVLYSAGSCTRFGRACDEVSDGGTEDIETLRAQAGLTGAIVNFAVDSVEGEGRYRLELSVGETLVEITEVRFQDLSGDEDAQLESGESWQGNITITNTGTVSADSFTVEATSSTAALRVGGDLIQVPSLASGASTQVSFTLDAQKVNEEVPSRVTLEMVGSTGHWVDSFSVVVTNPSFYSCPDADLGSVLGEAVYVGTTQGAGDNQDGSCNLSSGGEDVSLLWSAPYSGLFTFDNNGSELNDSTLYLRDGGCFGEELACDDDSGAGFLSSVTVELESGQQVLVVIDTYGAVNPEPFQLNIQDENQATPPPVDCPDIDLGSLLGPAVFLGTNLGAGNDFEPQTCGRGNGEDLSFIWTAPSGGSFIVDTYGSDFDTVLYALTEACNGTETACNDNGNSELEQSRLSISAQEGDVFIFVVDGYFSDSAGQVVVNVSPS